jgi:glucokinase
MDAAHMDATTTDLAKLIVVFKGCSLPGDTLALALSSGTNDFIVKSVESGHAGFPTRTPREDRYVRWGRREVGHNLFTFEEAIGGLRGWYRMFRFMLNEAAGRNYYPSVDLIDEVMAAAAEGDVSPVIERYARAGDKFCLRIVELFVGIVGSELHDRFMQTLPTRIVMHGSVIVGMAEFIKPGGQFHDLFAQRLVSPGSTHANLAKQVTVLVQPDKQGNVKGAMHLAEKALRQMHQ